MTTTAADARAHHPAHIDLIGERVKAYGGSTGVRGEGRVVAYTDRPTFTIETDDGERFNWIADLCRPTVQPEGADQ